MLVKCDHFLMSIKKYIDVEESFKNVNFSFQAFDQSEQQSLTQGRILGIFSKISLYVSTFMMDNIKLSGNIITS